MTRSWMSSGVRIGAVLIFAMLCRVAGAQSYLPILGGPGGGSFEEQCGAGQNLLGFELRTGDDVDAIRPVCAATYAESQVAAPVVGVSAQDGSWRGGPGGGQRHVLLCPDHNPIVLGMEVYAEGADTVIVNSIALYCGNAVSGAQTVSSYPSAVFEAPQYKMKGGFLQGADPTPHTEGDDRCPMGQVGIGMHGRSGNWLDAVGLICDVRRIASLPPGTSLNKTVGRVNGRSEPVGPHGSICNAAAARARNSPAAPYLEEQCRAMLAAAPKPTAPLPISTRAVQPAPCVTARCGSVPLNVTGATTSAPVPVQARTPVPATVRASIPICDSARSARGRNSPAAPELERQCRTQVGDPRFPGGIARVTLNPQPLPPRQ